MKWGQDEVRGEREHTYRSRKEAIAGLIAMQIAKMAYLHLCERQMAWPAITSQLSCLISCSQNLAESGHKNGDGALQLAESQLAPRNRDKSLQNDTKGAKGVVYQQCCKASSISHLAVLRQIRSSAIYPGYAKQLWWRSQQQMSLLQRSSN